MKSEIIIIGAGASGLMAAFGAADTLVKSGASAQVTLLEKMPRPGRKIMITGKGRCNFTNMKAWNEFSTHIRTKSNFLKPAFYNLSSESMRAFLESYGLDTVVERGDRAFPASYRASDVVDTLVNACLSKGVKLETDFEVTGISRSGTGFLVEAADGRTYGCSKLILATGGLSYPGTGSTGDGYGWALSMGHKLKQCFPSLTALVPKGYKNQESLISNGTKGHIDRSSPLSDLGQSLCGIQLKNVGVSLFIDGNEIESEFGDIDFTDGGIEGPAGFLLSRKAVKAIINGSKVRLCIDMKHGVSLREITGRVRDLWLDVDKDPRSARLREKEKCRILLGKLMPWELIPAFSACHPDIISLVRHSRTDSKVWVNLETIAKALKDWSFDIAGYVGYERAVVTAGGVDTDQVLAKTMESRITEGLYFCGELLDVDSDTGGYNLQTAFSTGYLAGQNAAKAILLK